MKRTVVALSVAMFAGCCGPQEPRPPEGMSAAPKPSKEHEWLRNFEGAWDFAAKFILDPGAAPMESKGVQVDRMTACGQWLIMDTLEEKKESPFHGHGMIGYDPEKKKFIGVWSDNLDMKFQLLEGSLDKDGKVMTMESEIAASDGTAMKFKEISTFKDKDHKSLKIVGTGPDGVERTFGEIEYTRRR